MKQVTRTIRSNASLILAILFSLCVALTVTAQVDNASLTGLIKDVNGAVIAGARVLIVNQATNISLETKSGEDGYYTIANLRPGIYEVTVEQQGFKRETRSALQLSVGQRARLDFALTVGQVSEAVTVTTDSIILQREDASLGNVVDNQRI